MPTQQTIVLGVQRLVGAAAKERGVAAIAEYVTMGLADLDLVSPYVTRVTLTGDGSDEYALASPWERGFSAIRWVRYYPDNDRNEPHQEIQPEAYDATELASDGTAQIRFYSLSPTSSDRVVIEYTARHTLTDSASTTTLTATQATALQYRAAAHLLRAAASSSASSAPQDRAVDFAVPGTSQADSYRRLADDMEESYRSTLGIPADGSAAQPAQFATVPVEYSARTRGRVHLTHPRRPPSWP